jgi:hypothetical protein
MLSEETGEGGFPGPRVPGEENDPVPPGDTRGVDLKPAVGGQVVLEDELVEWERERGRPTLPSEEDALPETSTDEERSVGCLSPRLLQDVQPAPAQHVDPPEATRFEEQRAGRRGRPLGDLQPDRRAPGREEGFRNPPGSRVSGDREGDARYPESKHLRLGLGTLDLDEPVSPELPSPETARGILDVARRALGKGEHPEVGDLAEVGDHRLDVPVLHLGSPGAAGAEADQAALLADGVLVPLSGSELREVLVPSFLESPRAQIEGVPA